MKESKINYSFIVLIAPLLIFALSALLWMWSKDLPTLPLGWLKWPAAIYSIFYCGVSFLMIVFIPMFRTKRLFTKS